MFLFKIHIPLTFAHYQILDRKNRFFYRLFVFTYQPLSVTSKKPIAELINSIQSEINRQRSEGYRFKIRTASGDVENFK